MAKELQEKQPKQGPGNQKIEKKEPTPEEIKLMEEEEVKAHSQELWLTRQFIKRPVIVMLITIVAVFLAIGVSIALEGFKQTESHDREYLIWDDIRVENFDLFFLMRQEFMQGQSDSGKQIPERSQEQIDWATSIIIKSDSEDNEDDYNILTIENIKAYYEAEQKIVKHERFKDFCLSDGTEEGNCRGDVFFSFTQYILEQEKVEMKDMTQEKLERVLKKVVGEEALFLQWKGFFGKNFGEKGSIKSNLLRNQIKFGGPVREGEKLYQDIFDEEIDQRGVFEEFIDIMLEVCRDQVKKPFGTRITPANRIIVTYETLNKVQDDFFFAFGSIAFVWVYIAFHLRSLFLASQGMLDILYSFPLTMVIFKGIFQIDYFSTLHVIVIFIVLGIAADNIFVFTDCWNQTLQYEYLAKDFGRRMAYTFRRASKAMLATSSTTGAAFLATGLSDIMPISSFGFFAGLLIPMNFILVITYYPASLMVYEYYFRDICANKIFNSCNKKKEKISRKDEEHQNNNNRNGMKEGEVKKEHRVEKFFGNQINNFVFRGKYVMFVVFGVWTGVAIWQASKLTGLSEQVSFLPDDYDVQDGLDALINKFHSAGNSDQGIKVYQYWGVKDIDKEGVSMWDPFDRGQLEWDESFNFAKNQQYFYDYCLKMTKNKLVQDGQIISFVFHFKQYLEGKGKSYPLPENELLHELTNFSKNTPEGQLYYNNNMIGLIKGEIKYVSIRLASHGTPYSPDSEIRPFYDEWEDWLEEEEKRAPDGMKNSRQTALLYWVLMVTEKALVTNAIQGILISMAFAFVVLVLTSYNIIISFYSVICIGGIVLSVMAVIQMIGWELGVSESVGIVILIGLSVDYVVHLANHYVECVYTDRFRKTQVALKDLGISIISGASTTLGSSLFLFFATITLFEKFAILIYATIIFSLLYSILLFSGLMHAWGPENDLGDIQVLFRKLTGKKEKKVEKEMKKKQREEKGNNDEIGASSGGGKIEIEIREKIGPSEETDLKDKSKAISGQIGSGVEREAS